MKKIISSLLIFMLATPSFAIEYVLEWRPYVFTDRETLLKDIHENHCSDVPAQIAAFESTNNRRIDKIQSGTKVSIQQCYKKSTLSEKSLLITGWEELEVPKNFVLSRELENRSCRQTYPHQIPKFYEKNNKIPYNVDLFTPGQKIQIQRCRLANEVVVAPTDEAKIQAVEAKETNPMLTFEQSQVFLGASDEKNNTTWNFGIRTSHLKPFTLVGDISGASNMVRISYNYFLTPSKKYALFVEPGLHFTNNRNGLTNGMAALGINYIVSQWQFRLSKNVTTNNGINLYVERMINEYWGIHLETINYYNRYQDQDIQFNKIGVGFYF